MVIASLFTVQLASAGFWVQRILSSRVYTTGCAYAQMSPPTQAHSLRDFAKLPTCLLILDTATSCTLRSLNALLVRLDLSTAHGAHDATGRLPIKPQSVFVRKLIHVCRWTYQGLCKSPVAE